MGSANFGERIMTTGINAKNVPCSEKKASKVFFWCFSSVNFTTESGVEYIFQAHQANVPNRES